MDLRFVFFILFLLCCSALQASTSGYVHDVRAERSQRFYEIFLFSQPPPRQTPLQEIIFNRELSKEFRHKYREKFGQIDTESITYRQNNFDRLDGNKGSVQAEQKNEERRSFANFMMKRLLEWHLDHYIKSEPTMRPLYDVKEKLKKVEVKVTKETKLEGRYDLAGNTLDILLENKVVDGKLTFQFDSSSFGPGRTEETLFTITRPISPTLRLENKSSAKYGRTGLELIRSHTPQFSTSYGVSAAYKKSDYSGESRLTAGLGYSF